MKGKRPSKIFVKVLVVVTAVVMAVILASYALVYALLPGFYRTHEINRMNTAIADLMEQLEQASDSDAETALLTAFYHSYGVSLSVYDEDDQLVFNEGQGYGVVVYIQLDETGSSSTIHSTSAEDTPNVTETLYDEQEYTCNGAYRRLVVQFSLSALTEAQAVIMEIYPYTLLCCLVLAVLAAVLISQLFVRPIKALNQAVGEMARMEPSALAPVTSADELGELSQNVNQLYTRLMGTIGALEQEISKNQDAENQKIDFLRTVSHELKTPLAAATALTEGMLYEIPPFDQNQKEHLTKCRALLEKAAQLARESLQFSKFSYTAQSEAVNLAALMQEVLGDYAVLISAGQLSCTVALPDDFILQTNSAVFTRVLSNVLSNAVHYTPRGGEIRIALARGEQTRLQIENTCAPLEESMLSRLFRGPYPGSETNPDSTGLGLYIVGQLLNLLHMPYRFAPIKDGMIFEIYLVGSAGDDL